MPNGLSDGAVIIDVVMDTSKVTTGEKGWKGAVERMKQTAARVGAEMSASMGGYLKTLQQASGAAKGAASSQSALEKEIAKTEAAIARLNEKQELARRRFEASREEAVAKATEKVGPYKGEEDYDLPFGHPETVEEWQERVSAAVNKAVEDFGAFEDSTAFRNTSTEIEYLTEKLEGMRSELSSVQQDGAETSAGNGVATAFANIAQNAEQAASAVAKIAGRGALSFLKKLAAGAKNAAVQFAKLAASAAKKLFGIGKGARQTGNGFQFSLKNLLRYGLGIRSLFVLFNRLRSAIKEGFGELANYDPRVKAALGSLKASLGGLKGSLSAAFAPILTAVAPALTTLIDLLTRAVNAVGMFFAAITGQGYYTAAKGIQAIDGAASSASGSAKDLKRQLAGFDELNILSAPGGGGGGSGGSGSGTNYTFEKTPIAASIQNFADQLKALVAAENWDGLGALFADKINGAFEKAQRLISWDNLGGKISQIIDAVAGTFNSLVSKIKWEKIGETFATGANTFVKTATQALTKFDFPALAEGLTRGLNNFIIHVEWRDLGRLIAKYAGTVVKSLLAALTTIEWADAGKAFADAVNGLFDDESLFAAAGDTITAAFKGFFEWSASFLENFDAIQAAEDIKTMLGRIKWGEIAQEVWNTAQNAFKRAGEFLKVLFGGDLYNVQGDAVDQLWDRGSGRSSSQRYAQTIGSTIGKALSNVAEGLLDAITWAIDHIDWTEIGDQLHEAILAVEWDDVIVKIVNAIVSAVQGLNDFFGALIFGKENWKNIKGAKEETETATNNALRTVVDKVSDTIGLEMDKGQRQNAANMLQDLGIVSLFGAPGSIYTTIRNLDRVFGGASAEEASLIDDREVIDSLDKNTRATEKDTRTREEKLAANVVDGIVGGTGRGKDRALTNALGAALWGETPDADVKVNFIPQGMSPAFVNKPLAGLQSAFAPGADVTGRVNLTQNNFSTVQGFVNGYQGGAVNKPIDLTRPSWWSTVQGFVQNYQGGAVNKPIDLTRSSAWSSVQGFVGGFMGGSVYKPIDLARSWWSTVQGFVQSYKGDNVAQGVYLAKDGWDWVDTWAKRYAQTAIEQRVVLKITDVTVSSGVAGARIAIGKAMGGIITAGGRSLNFASGGYLSGSRAGWWNSARKYASGTSRAHGSLFVAGEAGPEIVGHINGRTEILNKSQLAQTMYSAVTSGMIAALRGITFTLPAMATGGIMPYEVSAQIAKSTAEIESTLNANNEDLIQTIISVAGQIVAALNRQNSPQPVVAGGLIAQQVINEINRQTLMFGASPLKGV